MLVRAFLRDATAGPILAAGLLQLALGMGRQWSASSVRLKEERKKIWIDSDLPLRREALKHASDFVISSSEGSMPRAEHLFKLPKQQYGGSCHEKMWVSSRGFLLVEIMLIRRVVFLRSRFSISDLGGANDSHRKQSFVTTRGSDTCVPVKDHIGVLHR